MILLSLDEGEEEQEEEEKEEWEDMGFLGCCFVLMQVSSHGREAAPFIINLLHLGNL